MLNPENRARSSKELLLKSRKIAPIALGAVMISLLAATSLASKSLIQDRRVTLAKAQQMAEKLQQNGDGASGFPIVVNDLVLKELNRYIGTPEGRDFMRNALARMANYQTEIAAKAAKYELPTELLAIPIVESGYQDLPQDPNHHSWGAGLWMFIESTAKNYGLKIDSPDERLNVDLETDAAFRYLQSNHLRFGDWALACLAYNIGEARVQSGIDATGSRDAWALIRAGYENDSNYLARVWAAILIMKNPDSLN